MCIARWITGVRGFRAHHVENAMDGFVAAGSENRSAEDALGFGVDHDLHEALRFAFLDRAADAGHGALSDQCTPSALAHIAFG
jgi:hypothetical protein